MIDPDGGQLKFDLLDTNGSDNLQVIITRLEGDNFRVQIQEPDSDRYQLQDVLDGELNVLP